jgi:ParB family chromosome partitioning protein
MEPRLGRGLDSLIARTVRTEESVSPLEIPLAEIRANPRQPRRFIDEQALEGLAASIQNHGVLQPVVVRRVDGGYELIAGERRFRASRLAGRTTVPATVVDAEGIRSLELALIENIQRENLTALDEAAAYQQLVLSTGVTHQELAKRVGKSRTAVTNALRLLELPDGVRDRLVSGELSAGQARALLAAHGPDQMLELAEAAIRNRWSVREVEESVRGGQPAAPRKPRATKSRKGASEAKPQMKRQKHYEEELRLRFGTQVRITDRGGRGEVSFGFFTEKDRERLIHLLLTAGEAEGH